MISLGDQVKDTITGYRGIVTAHCMHLHNVDQFLVASNMRTHEGQIIKPMSQWFSVARLEPIPHDESTR